MLVTLNHLFVFLFLNRNLDLFSQSSIYNIKNKYKICQILPDDLYVTIVYIIQQFWHFEFMQIRGVSKSQMCVLYQNMISTPQGASGPSFVISFRNEHQ